MIGDAQDQEIIRRLDNLETRDYRGELDHTERAQLSGIKRGYRLEDDDEPDPELGSEFCGDHELR